MIVVIFPFTILLISNLKLPLYPPTPAEFTLLRMLKKERRKKIIIGILRLYNILYLMK